LKKAFLATYTSIVARLARRRILLLAQTVGRQKYQKKIAPLKTLIVVSNTLVVICSIIVVVGAKEKTLPISFGHSTDP